MFRPSTDLILESHNGEYFAISESISGERILLMRNGLSFLATDLSVTGLTGLALTEGRFGDFEASLFGDLAPPVLLLPRGLLAFGL